MDKKLALNVFLTFSYFLTSALMAAPGKITAAVAVSIVAGAVRATIGIYAKKRGAALPPDA